MQKEKKFEKIKKLLHQFKMRKVRFEEITYIKVKNIDDYIDLRNSIEKCFIDKKGININKLIEYKIKIKNAIEEQENKKEMISSFAFPICIILPSALAGGLLGAKDLNDFSLAWAVFDVVGYIFLFGMLICWINEYILGKNRDTLVFLDTIDRILQYMGEHIDLYEHRKLE